MKDNYIESALNEQLATLEYPTRWENIEFIPTKGKVWIRPTFMPAVSEAAAIGETAPNRITGAYHISVFAPVGKGVSTSGKEVETIMTAFKRDTALVYSGVTVKITKVWRTIAINEPDWYHIPVIVEWQADVDV